MHLTYQSGDSRLGWLSAIAFPERVGRWLMDLGFGSLVEKFEDRFGRRATTLLLFAIGAATLTICISTIIAQGIVPLVEFIRGVSSKTVIGLLSGLLIGTLIAVTSGAVFVLLVRWWAKRSVRPIFERAEEMVAEAEAMVAERIAESRRLTGDMNRLLDKVERRAKEIADTAGSDGDATGTKKGPPKRPPKPS